MKKIITLLVIGIVMLSSYVSAQVKDSISNNKVAIADSSKQAIRTAADLKSGNSQDVLSSFFKLGFTDLSSGRHFIFNSSLFAVKAKTDSTLWIDEKYKKEIFARNFTFGFDYAVDSSFRFKSATVNLKYAVVNNRDKDLFESPGGANLNKILIEYSSVKSTALNNYFQSKPTPSQAEQDSATNFVYPGHKKPTLLKNVPEAYLKLLKDELSKSTLLSAYDVATLTDSIKNQVDQLIGLMNKRALWVVGTNLGVDQQNLFSKADLTTEYLKGITNLKASSGLELDIKGDYSLYDTTVAVSKIRRQVFSAGAGLNWIVYKNAVTSKSYIEFKAMISNQTIFAGKLPDEQKNDFIGSGTLRFRITDDLWLPIAFSYDRSKGQFFGFLNITSNFDWLGAAKAVTKTP